MAIIYILQSLLFADDWTIKNILRATVIGLISGAIAGLIFGWLIGLFADSKFVTKGTEIETGPGETILFETPANHFKGIEGVGGKLYLTNKRLVFKSHKLNIQNHQLSLELTEIENAARRKSAGIINNGISVTTKDKKTEKFVVEQPQKWVEELAQLLK